jgi:hypothetical protein
LNLSLEVAQNISPSAIPNKFEAECISNSSRCFGATETFVVDYQGEAKLMGCLAVVLPELDSQGVSDAMSANSGHFIIDFVLLHSTTPWAATPNTWLETQLL